MWKRLPFARPQVLGKGGQLHHQTRSLLSQAFSKGGSEPPLLEVPVPTHFAGVVKQFGDRNAVISRHQNKTLTYEGLNRDSDQLARGLKSLGVKKGDRCCVMLGNNIEFATLTYALFKLGAVLVPLNPAFNSPQVVAALSHLSATHLIISAETNLPRKPPRSNVSLLQDLVPNIAGPRSIPSFDSEVVPSLMSIIVVDNSSGRVNRDVNLRKALHYEEVFEEGGFTKTGITPDEPLHPDEVVNIQFTSGTTSMPKAACLSHRSILNNGKSIGDRMLLTETDVVCCPPPLFHCFGCILGYMATATHGSAIAFPTESFDPEAALATVREYACTALYGVPTMFISELELLADEIVPRDGLSQLRTGIAAGSNIPAELMRRLHRELNLTDLTVCYGMTETSPVSCMTGTEDPIQKRVETVGKVLPHVTVKVVDPMDWARTLKVGERGELAVSGYLTMKGYWGDEERTGEVLVKEDDGLVWMHTGDEASMDEEGYVTITGRIKDLIIRGGENIHPLEIENCLLSHERLSDVSVVGVPDERYGEAVAAFIVVRHGQELSEQEVRNWVRTKLSNHLVPKYVFWVDGFPKTASGKIQKFKLRELAQELIKEGKGVA